jgi:hypothetical protein
MTTGAHTRAGVVVELAGGLGNQMFQYAAGRAVADRLGVDLGLDLRPLRAHDSRPYGLDAFAVRATPIPDRELAGVHGSRSWRWHVRHGWPEHFHRLVRRPRYGSLYPIVHQGVDFSEVLSQARPDAWLSGWWQSERYFAGIASRVRADLTLKQVSARTAEIERCIRARAYPVAVHVRRGDYASVPSTRAYHGLCSVEYYERAMARIRAQRPDATFLFFSDEPYWVAETFRPRADALMRPNDNGPADDLHLMTVCRAHVIANSSFSWWGAWLAASEIVIAPVRWFQAPGIDAPDVVPAGWLRL